MFDHQESWSSNYGLQNLFFCNWAKKMLFAKSKQPYQQDLWINISIEQAKGSMQKASLEALIEL